MIVNALDLQQISQKELERQFAAVVYQYPLYAYQECLWLDPATIIDEQVRKYWSTVRDRLDSGMDDDAAATVSTQAALEAGINGDMALWAARVNIADTPQAYAHEISRQAYITAVTSMMPELWKGLQAKNDTTVRELVDKLSEYGKSGAPESLPGLNDVHEKFIKLADDGQRAVETYISPLDSALGGLERQTLIVLAARPSMGKSAIALQIARNVAQNGKEVMFFSLEMSAVSLWARVACPLAGVTWRDVLANRLSKDKRKELKQHSESMANKLNNRLTVIDSRQTTEMIWRTVSAHKPSLVIVDHLRFIKDKGENENKRQGAICEALHDMAKAFDIPVLLLVQLNRDTEKQGDKRPQLSNLRDSGEIEETADNVLMMYRDSYYNPPFPPKEKDPTELWIRKFRNGPAGGKIELLFDKSSEWFEGGKV